MGYLISITIRNFNSFILYKLVHERLTKLNGLEEEQVVRILERYPEVFTRISVSIGNHNQDLNFQNPFHSLGEILSLYPSIINDFPAELSDSIVALQNI